ncbi:MAG TPA: MBL fold metallo-hydrolase [Candidatus Krumholzibacteria bacterium]|nr:MBL fold metallo-hydrolase [Candidatus Krumholzibacteria bacterium]
MHNPYAWMALAVALFPLASPAPAGTVSGKSYDIVTLADGVYGFVWSDPLKDPIEGNALFVINPHDVLVVDTGILPGTARAMVAELEKLTDRPVRYVVNTHWHDDHVNGNQVYEDRWPGVEFIAHRNTRTDVIDRVINTRKADIAAMVPVREKYRRWADTGLDDEGKQLVESRRNRAREIADMYAMCIPELESLRPCPPTLTFDDSLVIHRGERVIKIMYLGLGNTRGDTVVLLPNEHIAATGDLMAYPVPFGIGSYYKDWIDTLARVDSLNANVLFFGHGPPQRDRAYLRQVQDLLQALVQQVDAAVNAGATLEETQARVTLADWKARFAGEDEGKQRAFDAFFVQPAVERAWRQARGEPDAPEGGD